MTGALALALALGSLNLPAEEIPPAPATSTPRDLYNSGTKQILAGKLNEAEELLQNRLAAQDAALQPLALYNLGIVRVAQGAELLKKSNDPGGKSSVEHASLLTTLADDASKKIDEAIASQNEQKMIAAYFRGGGIQREIKAATKAVQQALDAKKDILAKWQRADGDFRSAAEMRQTDADASFNAETTEKAIAALIDKLNKLQEGQMKMKAAGKQLGDKMQKLKGMMQMPNMPPGAPGDGEDDDNPGMHQGEKEGAGKTGDEMKISPEQAEQMLAGYKLGGDRRLPLGQESSQKPQNHSGKTW